MSWYCGSAGWGPVSSDVPDLTPCAQSVLIESIPFLVFIAVVRKQIKSIASRHPTFFATWSKRELLRLASNVVLALSPLVHLLVLLAQKDPVNKVHPYILVSLSLQCSSWILGSWIAYQCHLRNMSPNPGVRSWWFISWVAIVKDFQSACLRTELGLETSSVVIITCAESLFAIILVIDGLPSVINPYVRMHSTLSSSRESLLSNWMANHDDREQGDYVQRPSNSIWNQWLEIPSAIPSSGTIPATEQPLRKLSSLNVVSWTEGTSDGDRFVIFSIEVESADECGSWTVSKRFRDCKWIGPAVKKAYLNHGWPCTLPEFPTSINEFSMSELAQSLQAFLEAALTFDELQIKLEQFAGYEDRRRHQEKLATVVDEIPMGSYGTPPQFDVGNHLHPHRSPEGESHHYHTRQQHSWVKSLPAEVLKFRTDEKNHKLTDAHVVKFRADEISPTVYDIDVQSSESTWTVSRRYRQFFQLHTQLLSLFDDRAMPSLPPKTILSQTHDFEFLEHRRRQLDIYLQSLVNSDYFECEALYAFLTEQDEPSDSRSDDNQFSMTTTAVGGMVPARQVSAIHKFDAVLVKWQFANASEIVYHFEISEYFSSNKFLKWSIYCSFDDFRELHAALKKRFPNDVLPDPPAVWPSLSMSAETNERIQTERAAQLELFLQKLINTTPLQCPEINAFLELDNNNREIRTGMTLLEDNALP